MMNNTKFIIVICAIYLEKYLTTITGYVAFMLLIPASCVLLSVNVYAKKPIVQRIAWKLMVFGLAVALVIPASVKASDMIDATYNTSIEATISTAMQSTDVESDGETGEGGLRGIINVVKDTISGTGDQLKQVLNNFIDALAVMIVTSCLIPILVMLFFVWLVRILLGTDLDFMIPPLPRRGERRHEHREDGP